MTATEAGHRRPSATRLVRFGPIAIAYDDQVLEPRPWTTTQSLWAAELADAAPTGPILELCCGAGQIGLLAAHLSGRELVAVDADPVACGWASANAERNGLTARVRVRNADLGNACQHDETFPVIIADPPWVPRSELSRFPDDPTHAIDGGEDGLVHVRACVQVIVEHLHPTGVALLQIGPDRQLEALTAELPPSLVVAGHRVEPGRGTVVRVRARP